MYDLRDPCSGAQPCLTENIYSQKGKTGAAYYYRRIRFHSARFHSNWKLVPWQILPDPDVSKVSARRPARRSVCHSAAKRASPLFSCRLDRINFRITLYFSFFLFCFHLSVRMLRSDVTRLSKTRRDVPRLTERGGQN